MAETKDITSLFNYRQKLNTRSNVKLQKITAFIYTNDDWFQIDLLYRYFTDDNNLVSPIDKFLTYYMKEEFDNNTYIYFFNHIASENKNYEFLNILPIHIGEDDSYIQLFIGKTQGNNKSRILIVEIEKEHYNVHDVITKKYYKINFESLKDEKSIESFETKESNKLSSYIDEVSGIIKIASKESVKWKEKINEKVK